MKIGIVGNYGNNNNGDEAILAGIIEQVIAHYNITTSDIVVFSNNPPQTSNRFGVESAPLYYKRSSAIMTAIETVRKNSSIVRGLDMLIIGGGGILMDFYNREAQLFGSYGYMAKRGKVPYIVYGCGAGPITSTMGKFFIRKLVNGAESASVRDPKSRDLLRKIGVRKDVQIVGDPSFALPSHVKEKSKDRIGNIGVTVVPYYNLAYWPEANDIKYDSYVQGMADNLDALLEAKDVNINLFSTKYPHDVDVTIDVYNRMQNKDRVTVNKENLSPEDIIKISAEQDMLIGTRLHSVYLAVNAKTPVMAISYHHKVADFMDMVDMGDRTIQIESLTKQSDAILEIVASMDEQWSDKLKEADLLAERMNESARLGMKQFISLRK
ncbi:polysaccharide pyruvyl transferase family protein [Sporosarcina ureilytica]|uniref:Polysaccharide pyruvyl transferase n=1 Tax=Sporosarcina ureilytica TaxID=298596 RepID=A0A1D8JJ71_9BACL|nr:polysaccharide pyruvyl transferase family protein [Sporosarcina ureilytica]AOV08756.1 polysaccharide pyruvyl transferase [Sporosarcina ureilytica]